MSTTTCTSIAERLGCTLGRGWRTYARGERRASSWFVSKGVPRTGATALVWVDGRQAAREPASAVIDGKHVVIR